MIQTGDPTGTGRGGASIYGLVWSLKCLLHLTISLGAMKITCAVICNYLLVG